MQKCSNTLANEPHLRSWWGYADVEHVASPNDQAAKVRRGVPATIFSGAVENYVHVAVAVDHLTPVLSIVL